MAALPQRSWRATAFVSVAALNCFFILLKFGTPIILNRVLLPPDSLAAALYESWPAEWAGWFIVPLVATGLVAVPWTKLEFQWPMVLPIIWLGWQWIAAFHSISPSLSMLTVNYFTVAVLLFYIGCFAMRDIPLWPIWTALALALCWMIHMGFEQHFGGLEATRQMVEDLKKGPGLSDSILQDPMYIKRILANRVFGTFSNPDALAAGIELLLPVSLAFLWRLTPKLQLRIRILFVMVLGGCGLATLFWTKSKAGWLVVLVMAAVLLIHSKIPKRPKYITLASVLILGLVFFGIRNAAFFQKDKNSVGARMTYWKVAMVVAKRHPLYGTGPGTFAIPYGEMKQPDDEMTRLCHNDYLEQACDSGVFGFLSFFAMILTLLSLLYRYLSAQNRENLSTFFLLWLGLLGVGLHMVVDYHLYVPALGWPMFLFLGFGMNFKNYR